MSWSEFDAAANGLVADLRAGHNRQPEHAMDFEPAHSGDAGGYAADRGYPDTEPEGLGGYVAHDEYGNADELTIEQAGEALTELAAQWDTLSPDEREFTSESWPMTCSSCSRSNTRLPRASRSSTPSPPSWSLAATTPRSGRGCSQRPATWSTRSTPCRRSARPADG
jgi:hypothetical protein